MRAVLISACLAGEAVRYDGNVVNPIPNKVKQWVASGEAILFCPEVCAGLCVPRDPAEIQGEGGGHAVLSKKARVVTRKGDDVTDAYVKGAEMALELCRKEGITQAILKERSPSCGSRKIYDGSFSGHLVPGGGVTTALLRANGIEVMSEEAI